MEYHVIDMTPQQLMGGGPRKRHPKQVFVAYRMGDAGSVRFRQSLQRQLSARRDSEKVRLTDGKVPTGSYWAAEIRDRIRLARLVAADVTGPSKEVLFECGFAYGLRKPILPVVASEQQATEVPRWLTPIQYGRYDSEAAVDSLVSDLHLHLAGIAGRRPPMPSPPVPGYAVWLRPLPWTDLAQEQFHRAAQEMGLSPRVIDIPVGRADDRIDQELIDRCTGASILFAPLDGTFADDFVHFVCGAILSRPRAGTQQHPLVRRIRLLQDPSQQDVGLAAVSALRCRELAVIRESDVLKEVRKFGVSHREWAGLDE